MTETAAAEIPTNLPTGRVAFLFTDIEGSTRLWENHTEAMPFALSRHDTILRSAIEQNGGYVFKTVGDSFCAAFPAMGNAVTAAIEAQLALNREEWGEVGTLKVRMGLHGGICEERDGDYFGPPVNRVARLMSIGHGGQTILSQIAYEQIADLSLLSSVSLRDMGTHYLKDLAQPEIVWQIVHRELPNDFPALRSLPNGTIQHNLPLAVTSFIGREAEIAAVKKHLKTTRLLTITGAGGSGKSRLSHRAAIDLLAEYDDGIWLAELATLTKGDQVAQAVAAVLNIREEPGKNILETLVENLRDKNVLLLIDNCEHLLDASAQMAATLIRACPRLTILASSREPLGIDGEFVWQLPTLSLPDPHLPIPPLGRLINYEAIALFTDRANAVAASFELTTANAASVVQICNRLDGIPQALELAAARVKSLPVEQIAKRLDDSFRILTGGSRAALPRQQTLKALIDWSYDLLTETEKTLLRRLSVLTGIWNLEMAEAICAGDFDSDISIEDWEILDLLSALVNKSLVVYREEDGQYRLLQTIWQYGRDRLDESGEADALHAHHADYFLKYGRERLLKVRTPGEAVALQELQMQSGNLRGAMEWARGSVDAQSIKPALFAELALIIGVTLQRFGFQSEAVVPIQAALDMLRMQTNKDNKGLSARLLRERAGLHLDLQETADARERVEEALYLFQELADERGEAQSRSLLGQTALTERAFSEARGYFTHALAEFERSDDRVEAANVHNNLGLVERRDEQGDMAEAERHHTEALRLFRELGDKRGMMESLNNLGVLAQSREDMETAWRRFIETLQIGRELRYTLGVAICFYNLGEIAQTRSDRSSKRQAFRFFAAAESLFETLKSRYAAVATEMLHCLMLDPLLNYTEEVTAAIRRAACDKSLDGLVHWSLEESGETSVQ